MAKSVNRIELQELIGFESHFSESFVGELDTWVFTRAAEKSLVASLLPPGLELAAPLPSALWPADRHPVVCFLGGHRDVRPAETDVAFCPILKPFRISCWDYLEAAAAVPFVRRAGATGSPATSYLTTSRLYLNETLPIWIGRIVGFPKLLGNLVMGPDWFDARTLAGSLVIHGDFVDRSPFQSPSSFPYFTALQPMFEMMHIGQLFDGTTWPVPVPLPLPFICMSTDFNFGTAQMQSVRGTIQVTGELSAALDPSETQLFGIDEDPLGAFRLRTTWTLSALSTCS